MNSRKQKYKVYRVRRGDGVYGNSRTYVGDTWATSAEQASNNVRFRLGEPKMRVIGDYLEEGSVVIYFTAELANRKDI